MKKPGYIYALINSSLDGLVKIGSTSRDPKIRASELVVGMLKVKA